MVQGAAVNADAAGEEKVEKAERSCRSRRTAGRAGSSTFWVRSIPAAGVCSVAAVQKTPSNEHQ